MMSQNLSEVMSAILRSDLKSFVRKVFTEVSGASEYQDNWHIDMICSKLIDMRDGEYNRLVVNIPPRCLKSVICSVALPAWLLGHDPALNIICISYSGDLSEKLAGDCRNIMTSPWYQQAFPNTRIDISHHAVDNFRTTVGGGRFSTSTGGTLTGMGAEWIIIDDPIKSSDAMSETVRDKCNEWYRSTLLSRLNNKSTGKILLIMQRLHEADLSGHILDTDDSYQHIKIPMVAEQDETLRINPMSVLEPKYIMRKIGDLLHPERDNLSIVESLRSGMGEYAFAGQYQQNPAPMGGGLIKQQWLHWYPAPKTDGFSKIIMSWDTASKTGENNAYSACITLGVTYDRKFYVLDCWRDRLNFPQLVRKVKERFEATYAAYKIKPELIVEDASSGTQLIQELKTGSMAVTAIKSVQDKIVRLSGISPQIENGNCMFPGYNPPWWKEFQHELLTFPTSRFADQCDALSQAVEYARTAVLNTEPMIFKHADMRNVFSSNSGMRVGFCPPQFHDHIDPHERRPPHMRKRYW
jgi:predicted phage terminase large subunit-like protein